MTKNRIRWIAATQDGVFKTGQTALSDIADKTIIFCVFDDNEIIFLYVRDLGYLIPAIGSTTTRQSGIPYFFTRNKIRPDGYHEARVHFGLKDIVGFIENDFGFEVICQDGQHTG